MDPLVLSIRERDRQTLRRLGKKPVLKRNFGFVSIFGFASTILIAWETTLITIQYGLNNGGPGGLVYQFIFIWFGVMLSFVIISELVSMAPVSGGQYHWVSMLAPTSIHKFLSYTTGWLTICGWQGNTAVSVYYSSSMIQGLAVLANPTYTPQPWHQILIGLGVTLFAVLINTRGGMLLPRFEGFMLILHIVGFFAVLIPLVVFSPHQTADEVFRTFMNTGNEPTQGISFLIGTIGLLITFCGADGAIHMAEEIENAAVVVPRAIVLTYLFNGTLAFSMLIATLFASFDVNQALSSPTQYPYMSIFLQGTGSVAGATAMATIITIMDICALISSMASTSRQIWSFARDHGVPGWQHISRVETKTSVPIYAVFLTATISMLLQLINLGSSAVFQDLTSITVAGLYSSYLIAVTLLLWRRCSGFISLFHQHGASDTSDSDSSPAPGPKKPETLTNTVNAPLTWGPWHLPGWAGIVLNAFVCMFLTVAWVFSFWPTTLPVTPQNMNYNSVLWGGVVLLSLGYYLWKGRKEYTGPIVEVVDGEDDESEKPRV
jgi:choline transport protein